MFSSLDVIIALMSLDLPEKVMSLPRNFSGASFKDFRTLSPILNVQASDFPDRIEIDLHLTGLNVKFMDLVMSWISSMIFDGAVY